MADETLRWPLPVTRDGLTLLALALVGLFLLVPAVFVFAQAFAKGTAFFGDALMQPEALAAIRLTLIVATISVIANTIFGLAAAWCITKFEFPGKNALVTLIDLPFSVSPVIAGLAVRCARLARTVSCRSRHQDRFRHSGDRARNDLRHRAVRRPTADPADARAGLRRGGSGTAARRLRITDLPAGDLASPRERQADVS